MKCTRYLLEFPHCIALWDETLQRCLSLSGHINKIISAYYHFFQQILLTWISICHDVINPSIAENAWVCTQHWGYWYPGAVAPGHQHPQCWPNIHCIRPVSFKIILFIVKILERYYLLTKQGKSEGFDSCDRPSNLTQIWFKSSIFQPVWPWNWMDDLEKL